MANTWTRWLREPLVQFLAIGALLFAVDRALQEELDDPRTIRVDATVHREFAELFRTQRGRLPTPAEMDRLVERHITNEVLIREARALRLDEGDEMMRERLLSRMRLMLFSGIEVEVPPEEELRAWYESNLERFTVPERISIEVLGLDATRDEAEAVAARLEGGEASASAAPLGRVPVTLGNRPRAQLVGLFNEEFVAAIEAGEEGVWRAVNSPQGWQVVRFLGRSPSVVRPFEDVRTTVAGEWRARMSQREASAALRALRESYAVEREAYGADVVATGDGAQSPPAPAADVAAGQEAIR